MTLLDRLKILIIKKECDKNRPCTGYVPISQLSEEVLRNCDDILNWDAVSNRQNLSKAFIQDYADKVNWASLIKRNIVDADFVMSNRGYVDWRKVSCIEKLSDDFIRKCESRIDWFWISRCATLSDSIIHEFRDKVNWESISQFQKLSESFIEAHKDYIDWDMISRYQKLSENFIEKHADKVNWNIISEHQKLSESFVAKHADKINWNRFSYENIMPLSNTFIHDYTDRINWFKMWKGLSSDYKTKELEDIVCIEYIRNKYGFTKDALLIKDGGCVSVIYDKDCVIDLFDMKKGTFNTSEKLFEAAELPQELFTESEQTKIRQISICKEKYDVLNGLPLYIVDGFIVTDFDYELHFSATDTEQIQLIDLRYLDDPFDLDSGIVESGFNFISELRRTHPYDQYDLYCKYFDPDFEYD